MTHALTYDTLPAHSQLRREYSDGVLRITALPEEPGPLVRRNALLRSAVPAGLACGVALLGCLAVFGMMYQANRRGIGAGLTAVLIVAFAIFCLALFALIWRVQYFARLDAVQNALKQTTLLAASKGHLIVETAGPLGAASHDLRSGEGAWPITSLRKGSADPRGMVDCLEIVLSDGSRIHLLPGRDEAELRWVARAITSADDTHTFSTG